MNQCRCSACHQPTQSNAGQHVDGTSLLWWRSTHCPHCGAAAEEDGHGPAPDEIREHVLARDGTWVLRLSEGDRIAAFRVVRAVLELDLRAAAALLHDPGDVLWRGTEAEVRWLGNHLTKEGISTVESR